MDFGVKKKSVINDFFSEVNIFLVICKNLVEKIIFLEMDQRKYLFLISLVSSWRGVLWILIMI